ncbi:hypothetical protein [Modestobacter versicolor]|uniref:hypothetical protein n=1 Tax=Modestobacter versicolor TaxID=429133 RepID=UPI0034DFDCF6
MDDERSGPEVLSGIAEALDVSEDDVLRALGGGWRPVELAADTPGRRRPLIGWFVSGEPMQVLLRVAGSTFTVSRLDLRWDGPGTTSIHPTHEREFAREDVEFQPSLVAETVEDLAVRSRRTFRWCRTCRIVKRLEHMAARLECMACAADYRGARY